MLRTKIAVLLSLSIASGCTGEDGTSFLTDLGDEPAGANCANGGIRISTGPDANDNGTLEESEATESKYVCTNPTLTAVAAEAAGANCSKGGVKIQAGPDTNANGTLDAGEVTSTNYVCGSGEAVISKSFFAAAVPVAATGETDVIASSVTTTSGGDVLAIATSDAFCTVAECPAGNPAVSGAFYIATDANATASPAEYDLFFLNPASTLSVTRTAKFPITAAGTYGFKSRADRAAGGTYQLYRNGLTLVFIP
jgi:hypothetical protein